MRQLILALLTWITAETGLEMPPAPAVAVLPPEQMPQLSSGRIHAEALYERRVTTIYLRDDWNSADLYNRAVLLHELVHHVQEFNRVPAPCAAAREEQAYRLTFKWLKEQGVTDPYAFLDVDEFTIAVLSMCIDDP